MGTIVERRRANGSTAYLAKISIMRDGRIVHRENKTFDRRPAAAAWIAKREAEVARPGAIERLNAPSNTVLDAIERYEQESVKEMGRTKAATLAAIKRDEFARTKCQDVNVASIVDFAKHLAAGGRSPATVANWLSHLSPILDIARPAWGYQIDPRVYSEATPVLARLGLIGKPRKRDRRPTIDEINRLMEFFETRSRNRRTANPMHAVVAFAIFSTRRQGEIIRLEWSDLDGDRIMVRDMKHPGGAVGNDQWCGLTPEAAAIITAQPKRDARIFPFSEDAVSAAFTRAADQLRIDDLRFHDLRHEGVSRLFEMGQTIPQVATISGHRSWSSLQRYAHLRQSGDKFAGWKWLPVVTANPSPP